MKTLSLLFIAVCLGVALNFSVAAQQATKARRARQKSAQPQKKSEQPVADKAGKQEQEAPQLQPSQTQPAASKPQAKSAIERGDDKAQSEKLPGAKGPLYEYVGKAGPKVIGADVGINRNDANSAKPPKARIFPSGTKKLRIEAKLGSAPRSWSVKVYNTLGQIEMEPGVVMQIVDPRTGEFVLGIPLDPKTGKFDDGPYQARVELDGNIALLINWEMGGDEQVKDGDKGEAAWQNDYDKFVLRYKELLKSNQSPEKEFVGKKVEWNLTFKEIDAQGKLQFDGIRRNVTQRMAGPWASFQAKATSVDEWKKLKHGDSVKFRGSIKTVSTFLIQDHVTGENVPWGDASVVDVEPIP